MSINIKFTEAKLEEAFIELLGNEGNPHYLGNTITRNSDEVLIEEDLIAFLLNQYKKEGLTITEAKSIVLQLKTLSSSDLYETNKTIMQWLADGSHNSYFLCKNRKRYLSFKSLVEFSAYVWKPEQREKYNCIPMLKLRTWNYFLGG